MGLADISSYVVLRALGLTPGELVLSAHQDSPR